LKQQIKIPAGWTRNPVISELSHGERWLYLCMVDLAVQANAGGYLVNPDGSRITTTELFRVAGVHKSRGKAYLNTLERSLLLCRLQTSPCDSEKGDKRPLFRGQTSPCIKVTLPTETPENQALAVKQNSDRQNSTKNNAPKVPPPRRIISHKNNNLLEDMKKKNQYEACEIKQLELVSPVAEIHGLEVWIWDLVLEIYKTRDDICGNRVHPVKRSGEPSSDARALADRVKAIGKSGTEHWEVAHLGRGLTAPETQALFRSLVEFQQVNNPHYTHPSTLWTRERNWPWRLSQAVERMKKYAKSQAGMAKSVPAGVYEMEI
jgi:hypothetical protein